MNISDALQAITRKMVQYVDQQIADVRKDATSLLADAYQGTYSENKDKMVPRGSLITHGGNLWLAIRDTQGTPGSGPPGETGYRLIVKKGSDAG